MQIDSTISEQPPLLTTRAHVFQVDPETRKSWLPLSKGAVNVQIFHDSVKNVYRILSVDESKVLINTAVTSRMSFTKTSQKFCQWVDTRANNVYGLGFSTEPDLIRFMEKFLEVKEATRAANKHNDYRSSSVDARQTPRSEPDWSTHSNTAESSPQTALKQENAHLKLALAQSSANAKKWQEELEILRNNNAKLTTALQESHGNVEEWKRQLQFYRDECSRLRQLVSQHHSSPDGQQYAETNELKSLLDNADRRNEEQEKKILHLENQIQRYLLQINNLEDRLASKESESEALRVDLQQIRLSSPSRSIGRNQHQQLIRLRDLIETKSNELQQTVNSKAQDLHRLCSQITQAINEL